MNTDAVQQYKELAGYNTEALRRMRDRDRAVAEELRKRLAEVDQALAEATERERVARMSVRLHWEAAVEALWNEKWLEEVPAQPEPAEPVTDLDTLAADAEVDRTYQVLREALRKPALLPRRSGQDRK